jgi:RNA polymerase sigma-70 factor (ECF subfamily)
MAHTTTTRPALDAHARWVIRTKARQLIGKAGFTPADRADIEQELALALLSGLPRFDASRGKRTTFVDRVVNNRVAALLTERTAKRRAPACCVASLDDDAPGENGSGATEPLWATLEERTGGRRARDPDDDEQRQDLRIDLAAALAELPEDLREIAAELAHRTPGQIARERGISRRTVRCRIERIRARFVSAGLEIYAHRYATSPAFSVSAK